MPKVDKIDAFSLVVKALDRGDNASANEMMKVLSDAIKWSEKQNKKTTSEIELTDEKGCRLFREVLK